MRSATSPEGSKNCSAVCTIKGDHTMIEIHSRVNGIDGRFDIRAEQERCHCMLLSDEVQATAVGLE